MTLLYLQTVRITTKCFQCVCVCVSFQFIYCPGVGHIMSSSFFAGGFSVFIFFWGTNWVEIAKFLVKKQPKRGLAKIFGSKSNTFGTQDRKEVLRSRIFGSQFQKQCFLVVTLDLLAALIILGHIALFLSFMSQCSNLTNQHSLLAIQSLITTDRTSSGPIVNDTYYLIC